MKHAIVITGSMGAGKTMTLGEASDLLAERAIVHAAIDLDALGLWHTTAAVPDILWQNLRCVCANYAAAGIDRLLIAAAVETGDDLRRITDTTSTDESQTGSDARSFVVCRLRAPLIVMEERVAARERGVRADQYIARVRILDRLLDAAGLEHFTIDTDRPVTAVAHELLRRARWID